jgi:RES domain
VLPEKELREALLDLPTFPEVGIWSRVIGYHLIQGPPPESTGKPQPLWPDGAVQSGGRFTPKGSFGSLYLASDPVTALSEVAAVVTGMGPIRTPPWVVFTVEGFVEKILDLTNPHVQSRLGTSLSELTGDWRFSQDLYLTGKGPIPPTQLLGKVAFEAGKIFGVRYHSTKRLGEGSALVVFSDRLVKSRSSFLEVYDPNDLIRQRLP